MANGAAVFIGVVLFVGLMVYLLPNMLLVNAEQINSGINQSDYASQVYVENTNLWTTIIATVSTPVGLAVVGISLIALLTGMLVVFK